MVRSVLCSSRRDRKIVLDEESSTLCSPCRSIVAFTVKSRDKRQPESETYTQKFIYSRNHGHGKVCTNRHVCAVAHKYTMQTQQLSPKASVTKNQTKRNARVLHTHTRKLFAIKSQRCTATYSSETFISFKSCLCELKLCVT